MNETTFENAKVGDRVWDMRYGWGRITFKSSSMACPIWVDFGEQQNLSFSFGGYADEYYLRTLYWDEVKFEVPTRPKRKVKKVMEGWINVYPLECVGVTLYMTIDKAKAASRGRNSLGEPLFIHHEYEVEE